MGGERGGQQGLHLVHHTVEGLVEALVNLAARAVRVIGLDEIQIVDPVGDGERVGTGEGDDDLVGVRVVCDEAVRVLDLAVEGGGGYMRESLACLAGPVVDGVVS